MSKQLNFAQQMDEVLKTLGPARPKLLLHACCGPCSSAVLEQLCEHFEITVLYYNPNTSPAAATSIARFTLSCPFTSLKSSKSSSGNAVMTC